MKAAIPAVLAFSLSLASASSAAGACFDFAVPVSGPLKEVRLRPGNEDASQSGKLSTKGFWSATRGVVERPIAELYELLLDHYTIKDPAKVKLRTYRQPQDGYARFHLVMIEANPLPLVTVSWEENWGYVVTEGTAAEPRKIVVSYEKTAGTRHIALLCGSIVLSALSEGRTEVYLYEEIDAFGKRSNKDMSKAQRGTLRTLRSKALQKG